MLNYIRLYCSHFSSSILYSCCWIDQQEAFEKCWAHLPQWAASRPFSRCR